MHFCFITTGFFSAHAAIKRAWGMAPVLQKMGYLVTVVLQDHPENRAVAELNADVDWVFFPKLSVWSERKWKRTFLDNNSFNVIIYNALAWRNLVRGNGGVRPLASFVEHCELESANQSLSIHRRFAMYCLEWWALIAFPGQLAASRYLVDLLNRRSFFWGLRRVIIWSPYAVDASVISMYSQINASDYSNGRKLILHIGTVAANYGCIFMLEGLKKLSESRSDWRAIFVGHGPDLEKCRAWVSAAGLSDNISFPGFLPESELRELLRRGDVFLSHLNNTEQDWARCPSKLYYYMAIGRPVVTAPLGENVLSLGWGGFYYNPNLPADFATATGRALDVAPDWSPPYSASSVTWTQRTIDFIDVLKSVYRLS